MISSPALRSTVLASACLVALSIAGTAEAATNRQVHMAGNLSAAGTGSSTVTYDPKVAPVGARLAVDVVDAGEGATRVTLDVAGMLPDRDYAARAHVAACGATAADAGGLFRNTAGPAAADAQDEIRLDLHTDGQGDASAETEVPFSIAARAPGSVVLHVAGTAGDGVACLSLSGS